MLAQMSVSAASGCTSAASGTVFKLPAVSPIRAANGQIGVQTPPVVSNGRLYIRDQEWLYCYAVSAK